MEARKRVEAERRRERESAETLKTSEAESAEALSLDFQKTDSRERLESRAAAVASETRKAFSRNLPPEKKPNLRPLISLAPSFPSLIHFLNPPNFPNYLN